MADQTLTTRLAVKDEASKPTEQYAKLIDGLDGDTATVVLALKAAQVQQDLTQVLEDLAKVDAADPTIDVKIANAAELKSQLDGLKTEMESLQSEPVELNTKPATEGVKELGHEADQSRSVLANMVGNSAQDLGELGGQAGTAGVAIGQLAEYAADGNIKLSGLVSTLGPMLALGVGVKGLADHAKRLKELKAFDAKQVSDYAEALKNGASAADALTQSLTAAGKVQIRLPSDLGISDITEFMANMGLSVSQFSTLVAGSQSQVDLWAQAMRDAGKEPGPILLAIDEQRGKLKEASDQAAIFHKVFGDAVDGNTGSLNAYKDALANSVEQATAEKEATKASAQAHTDAAQAIRDETDARRAWSDSTFALHDAQQQFREDIAGLPKALKDAGGDWGKIQQTLDDVAQSAGKVADAQVEVGKKAFAAQGVIITQRDELDIWNDSMLRQAATLKGPARDALLTYISNVNGIPPEKLTDITADLDQGSVDSAKVKLDNASTARSSLITADADTAQAQREIEATADKPYTATIDVEARLRRDQLTKQLQNAGLIPTGSSVSASSASRAVPQTVIVNLPRGARYTDIARAMEAHTRHAGRRWASPGVTYARR